MSDVLWHDLECGGYTADLGLWRELAADAGGPVLDLGAGTGRVALDLARAGHPVVALDRDPELLGALAERAVGLPVTTVCADARDFDLAGPRFRLILVPMQTAQLLGGREGRAGLLRSARAHLRPGGLVAAALADTLEAFEADDQAAPAPDMTERDGVVYASRPVAVRPQAGRVAIERVRETVDRAGRRTAQPDVVYLDAVDADDLATEARAHGFTPLPHRHVAATDDHVGSTVVVLRG